MQTKHLCVLIHIWTKCEDVQWNWLNFSSKIFLLTVPRRYFFCGSFVLFISCICHTFLSVHCCLVLTCWERLTFWLLFVMFNCVLSLSHAVSWVRLLDCNDSWSLPPFLLLSISKDVLLLLFIKSLCVRYILCYWFKYPHFCSCKSCLEWGLDTVLHVWSCICSLVPSPRPTHLGSGNVYSITSRESYSCDCACSRKDFSTQTSDFFICFNLIIK